MERRDKTGGQKEPGRYVQTFGSVLQYDSKSSQTQVLLLVDGSFIQEQEKDARVQDPAYFH